MESIPKISQKFVGNFDLENSYKFCCDFESLFYSVRRGDGKITTSRLTYLHHLCDISYGIMTCLGKCLIGAFSISGTRKGIFNATMRLFFQGR